MLAGVKVWAFAHLLANGDLGSILLFGSSWPGRSRRASASSAATWCATTPARRPRPPDGATTLIAVAVGTAAWLVFALWLHPWLIGVAVWPGPAPLMPRSPTRRGL